MRVHYHTDCPFFAGCEQMLTVLLPADPQNVLTYRWSRRYEHTARGRLPDPMIRNGRLILPDTAAIRERLAKILGRPLLLPTKILMHALPLRQAFILWDVAVLYRRLRRSRPDILHINNGGFPGAASCNAAVIAAKLAGVPATIYVVNNVAEDYRKPWRLYDYPLDRLVSRCVTRFVTGSVASARAIQRVLRVPSSVVTTIHNGIGHREPDESIVETRARLSIPGDTLLLATVALLERRKGHRILIDAMSRLRGQNLIALIEGEGPELQRLRALADKLQLGSRVRFVGSERNVYNLLRASDIIVFPSIGNEDFPNVPLEAMSLGKPVIASRVGGTPEQIVDGQTGVLVPPGDPDALAAAITKLASDATLRRRMGELGRARFASMFTSDVALEHYLALYRDVLMHRTMGASGP